MDIKTMREFIKANMNLQDVVEPKFEFASVKTQDGGLELQYDGELAVDTSLVVVDSEGSLLPAPDATYVLEDGTSVVVVEGKIEELVSPEALETEEEELEEEKTEMAKEAKEEEMEDETEEEMEDEAVEAKEEMEDEVEEEMEDEAKEEEMEKEDELDAKFDSLLTTLSELLDEKVGKLEAKVIEMEAKVGGKPATEPTIVASNKTKEVFSKSEHKDRTKSLENFFKNR